MYHASRRCLNLREPTWTSDGEFLNADRFALLPQPNNDFGNKFTTEAQRDLFQKVFDFLDQIVRPHGFAYKDVTQPFVVAAWIKENQPPTIKLKRNIADVAYSMLQNHWHYPKRLFQNTGSIEIGVIQGLLQAQRAIDSIPAPELDFDGLIYDESLLQSILVGLYGNIVIKEVRYLDDGFRRKREEIMKRRSSAQYQRILEHVEKAKQTMG